MIDPGNAIMQLVDALDAAKRPADALDTMRGILAECWDDCVTHLPPKLRDADAPNPYRDLTTAEFAALDDAPERDQLTTARSDDPRGVWIVWRTGGDPTNGFNGIYPGDYEIEALRQVNADGFGQAEFIQFGMVQR